MILINLKKNKLQNKNVDENSIKAIYFLVTLRNMDDVFSAFLVKNHSLRGVIFQKMRFSKSLHLSSLKMLNIPWRVKISTSLGAHLRIFTGNMINYQFRAKRGKFFR